MCIVKEVKEVPQIEDLSQTRGFQMNHNLILNRESNPFNPSPFRLCPALAECVGFIVFEDFLFILRSKVFFPSTFTFLFCLY